MPNLTVYIPDALEEALARFSSAEINRSKVCADALRRAIRLREQELIKRGPVTTKIQTD